MGFEGGVMMLDEGDSSSHCEMEVGRTAEGC